MTLSSSPDHARVLLVDDEPGNIRMLNELLANQYEIFIAKDGETALNVASNELPDLILLDVTMPGVDGYEVLRRLKKNDRTAAIPVIFVTGMSSIADEKLGLELGAVDYITKPISPPILDIRVRNHIELKRQRDLLRNLSIKDGLTGIYNRRYFDEFLNREWKRSLRCCDESMALILMDIDHFKAYNDNYGHSEGDNCLKQIASALSGAVPRATDLIARYGGEEFVCVLPNTSLEVAVVVGKRLAAKVNELALTHAYSSAAGHVTLSMGAAAMVPSLDITQDALIIAADRNLYRAKETGRNRLVADS